MFDATTEAGGRAARRLWEEQEAWLTTVRSDGQPQAVPVWFLWDGETFLVYSQENAQKLRNLSLNPRAHVNLNSDGKTGNVVRAECTAEILEDFPRPDEIPEYVEKYREGIARIDYDVEGYGRDYPVPIRLTPTRWQVW